MGFMIIILLTGCKDEDISSIKEEGDNKQLLSNSNWQESNAEEERQVARFSKVEIYTEEELRGIVEGIDMSGKPSLVEDKRHELRTSIYNTIGEKSHELSNSLNKCKILLSNIVVDDRYLELLDKEHKRWAAYSNNDFFGIQKYIEGAISYIPQNNTDLIDDLWLVVDLCDRAINERDVASIIDARRILYDIEVHLFRVPTDENVDYGDIHKIYFGVTKTLGGDRDKLITKIEQG